MQRTVACARGRTSGNRLLFTAVAVVSIVIFSAAGIFAWRTVSVRQTVPSLNTADPTVGYAFYAALGQVLAGDEATSLQRLVTDDFVDHESNAAPAQGIDGLTAELSAFGATFPNARVAVESIESSGDSLVAQLSPSTLAGGSVAGLTMAPVQIANSVEVLHIRHGRVSERWSTRLLHVQATTFAAASTTSYTGGPTDAWLYRAQVPSGGELGWQSGTLSVVLVEAGTLSLTTTTADELGVLESQTEQVAAGSAQQLPHQAKVRLRSADGQTIRLLLLDARSSDDQQFTPFKRLGGVTSKLLWHTEESFQLGEPWRLEIGRLELPAGFELELANPSGLETVLEVEKAPVRLSTDSGAISHLETSYTLGPLDPSGVLDAGTAAQLTGVTAPRIRGSGSVSSTIWVMTFGPSQPLPESATPDPSRPAGQQGRS
jgi:predicted ester cyclase